MNNTDPRKTQNPCGREGWSDPASDKTPDVLLIVKSYTNIVVDRSVVKAKYPLSFEKYIFPNGQPVGDDKRVFFVSLTST